MCVRTTECARAVEVQRMPAEMYEYIVQAMDSCELDSDDDPWIWREQP